MINVKTLVPEEVRTRTKDLMERGGRDGPVVDESTN